MKLAQGSEMNPANSVKPEERRGSKNGRYKSVKSTQTNERPGIYMRPGYRTKSHSPGEDLEGNQGSPRVGKIFVDLRLAIKDLMRSKCHSFFYSVFLSNFRIGKNPFKAPVGVGTQQSVLQGGSAQRSNPFNTLWQKSGTSLLTNVTPFTYLVQNIASL